MPRSVRQQRETEERKQNVLRLAKMGASRAEIAEGLGYEIANINYYFDTDERFNGVEPDGVMWGKVLLRNSIAIAVKTLAEVAAKGVEDKDRIAASKAILDRAGLVAGQVIQTYSETRDLTAEAAMRRLPKEKLVLLAEICEEAGVGE